MARQMLPPVGISLSLFLLIATAAPAVAADSGVLPTRWTVNGNGVTGVLEIVIGDDGSLTGRLLDGEIEGYISGRHLLIRRAVEDRVEIWEGWLGQPRHDGEDENGAGSNRILAGTISVEVGGGTQVYPWFATPDAPNSGASATPGSVAPDATAPADPAAAPIPDPASASSVAPVAVPAPAPSTASAPAQSPPPSEPAAGPLSGFWSSMQGRIEIVQEGNQLTAILPDGSSHSGRMTGDSTLVVGLGKGCCNGQMEGPDAIAWSDGTRWKRAE